MNADSQELKIECDAYGLCYVTGEEPGITRRLRGKAFVYFDPGGKRITSSETIARINDLVIPPAYTDVWICANPMGHIQATGRDDRNRKQYRYHPLWVAYRNESKFSRLKEFVEALPAIREQVERDLRLHGFPRRKIIAAVVRLLETTLVRVGNEEYARANQSFGLTTLRNEHVVQEGNALRLTFRGKSGKDFDVPISDRRVARIIRGCMELPGHNLFTYCDENICRQSVGSSDVNDYLREVTGLPFTAKDFRTWGGTLHATRLLIEAGDHSSQAECKRKVVQAVKSVAKILGNTAATCRKYYIHPKVIELYERHELESAIRSRRLPPKELRDEFREEELALWRLLNA
jgi:DNA topoisomerase-1